MAESSAQVIHIDDFREDVPPSLIQKIQSFGVTVTPTGLRLPDGLAYKDWVELGDLLRKRRSNLERRLNWTLWALGDWLTHGEGHYGERHAQALDETDYAQGTIHNIASVAKRVPIDNRTGELSFWNHSEVAKLDPPDQSALLQKAAKEGLRKMEIREEANRIEREQFGKSATPVWDECPHCVGRQYPAGKIPREEPPDADSL